ncbi:MAG: DnaJ domain-containing protein [Spirochaetota bacterium]|nr:DnaJ domain-containing protein [Spirochaetota bacterium]
MDLFKKYITIFGLESRFTLEELSEAYRTLAMLYHPDISRDTDALQKMQLINTAYDYLKQHADSLNKQNESKNNNVKDDVYAIYKHAFTILQQAFYYYYTDGTGFTGNKGHLVVKLKEAKALFSKIIKEYPYNEWVDDAIDKINSINKWL